MTRRLGDYPSVEEQLATLTVHVSNLLLAMDKVNSRQEQFNLLQREQNGNVSRIAERENAIERRQNLHDEHHGEKDKGIAARLGLLEDESAERVLRRKFYHEWWVLVSGGVALGATLFPIIRFVLEQYAGG